MLTWVRYRSRSSEGRTTILPVRPWRSALIATFCFPSRVLGPVDFWALARFAAACLGVGMGLAPWWVYHGWRGKLRGKWRRIVGKWFGVLGLGIFFEAVTGDSPGVSRLLWATIVITGIPLTTCQLMTAPVRQLVARSVM